MSVFVRISMPDGRVLAARMWRPADAARVPAILEFRPYRGFDLFRPLEDQYLPAWAEHGYAVLAVDTAGSGQSSGLLADEYLDQEIEDAIAAIAWCAAQDWCDGQVGLSGMSWSAFTALRVAARRPAALKALALGGVSEDGWRTDIHNLGGALYAARVDWAGVMLQLNALPPDPQDFGAGWKDAWLSRLAANRPWIETWLSHPARDAYWADKAVAVEEAPADLPLLLYAGWADKYATSVLRIAAAWPGPVRTIVGPWEHTIPDLSRRRPRIDYAGEALAWWDHWLKGVANGVLDDPPLRAWIGAPDRQGGTAEGRWAALASPGKPSKIWSLAAADARRLGASDGAPAEGGARLVPAPRTPAALGVDRYEDGPGHFDLKASAENGALVLASDPMTDDIEICGAASLRAVVRPDQPGGLIVARLIDIDADGAAVRMTTGALNLRFRDSEVAPSDPAPGVETAITVTFQASGWRLRRGHRLALVLGADGWPTLWPDPAAASIDVRLDSLRLDLPLAVAARRGVVFDAPTRTARADVAALQWIDPQAEGLAPSGLQGAAVFDSSSAAHHLPATGTDYFSVSHFELALTDEARQAMAVKTARTIFQRPDWSVRVDTRLSVASTPAGFDIRWTIRAEHDGAVVYQGSDGAMVPRVAV
jgi:putative CocE/NonD family hydrolase